MRKVFFHLDSFLHSTQGSIKSSQSVNVLWWAVDCVLFVLMGKEGVTQWKHSDLR